MVKAKIETYSKESSKLLKPKRAFVVADDWDEKLDGPYDPAKAVERDVFGGDEERHLEEYWAKGRLRGGGMLGVGSDRNQSGD